MLHGLIRTESDPSRLLGYQIEKKAKSRDIDNNLELFEYLC